MTRTIVITSKHELGIDGAKTRISDRFAALKTTYMDRIGSADLVWDGATGHAWASALGQRGTGILAVEDQHLTIEIELPWLLAGMAGTIEAIIRGNADALTPTAKRKIAA